MAANDLVLVVLFAPIVKGLLGPSQVIVPYLTIFLSVALFVVIPLALGYVSRDVLVRRRGKDCFESAFLAKLRPITISGLLLTLVILFSFQREDDPQSPAAYCLDCDSAATPDAPHLRTWLRRGVAVAGPAAQISASNFFELAVTAAISLFGLESAAALATVVGVLVEVSIMLALVGIANRTRPIFTRRAE